MYLLVTDVSNSDPSNIVNCKLKIVSSGDTIFSNNVLSYYSGFKFLSTTDEQCNFTFDNLSGASVLIQLYIWQ